MIRRNIRSESRLLAVSLLFLTVVFDSPASAQTLDTMEIASGLVSPVFVTHAPGDFTRLLIIEQPGRIRVVHNGTLLATPFLDITSKITNGGERGLLGLAFHPNYQNNGYFYVNYTRKVPVNDGATVVARYQVSADSNVALPASETIVLTQAQPQSNHNAGWIGFGPNDGYLYIAFGDGGGSGDPGENGQDSTTWLGKLLRIDVDSGTPYAVPPGNPFVGTPGWLPEIWALGVRNPWRNSFDASTGDLYIADVGQNQWEEINFQPASSTGGENYGWRYKEGDHCYNPSTGCDTMAIMTDPIDEYQHNFSGGLSRCSITGGYVYRGSDIPGLQGAYFYADYCGGEIWSFKYNGSAITDSTDHTDALNPDSANISSFGEDAYGELYYCALSSGKVVKIIEAVSGGCCIGIRGNVDGDVLQSINIADVTYIVAYSFGGGPPPPCPEEGDINGVGGIDIADVTYLVAFSFKGGSAPPACP